MRRLVTALAVGLALLGGLAGCSDRGKPCSTKGAQEWHSDGGHSEHLTCVQHRGGLEWQ